MFIVSAQTRANRLNTCRGCEHFVESTQSCGPLVTEAFTDSKLCGCHMPTKTRLKWAECPLGKWEAVITGEQLAEEFEAQRQGLDAPVEQGDVVVILGGLPAERRVALIPRHLAEGKR